ncbi:CUB domain [Trinorchestia longiramus]|nr:CUB domain [Trinorchestia longiramus]
MRTSSLLAVMLVVGIRGATLPQEQAGGDDPSLLEDSDQHRDSRLFFQFISVRPDECTTTDAANPNGICYSPTQCSNLGGTGAGNCAAGLGTCCYFTRTCGGTTYGNGTAFVNPSYPSTDTTLSNCQLIVDLLSDNICQLRLDFETFELEQPNTEGECETDFMKITGSANDNSIPTLCGTNTGKHMYVDLDPTGGNPKINIDTGATSSVTREWKINVDQIACDSQYRAPEGCTQYYMDSSGVVESFNYVQPTDAEMTSFTANIHLNNLRYGVCVASRSDYCSITWSKNDNSGTNPYTFIMSGAGGALGPIIAGVLISVERSK